MLRCAASLSGFSRSLQRVGRVVRLPGRCDAIKWMVAVQERSLGWFACALHARAGSDSCTAARLDVAAAPLALACIMVWCTHGMVSWYGMVSAASLV